MILEGWRDAISADQYAAVQYDCASAGAVAKIRRLAKKERLTPPEFIAAMQTAADEIRSITAVSDIDKLSPVPDASAAEAEVGTDGQEPPPRFTEAPAAPPEPAESPEAGAERERIYRQIMGIPEPKPRRRWRP